MTVLSLDFETKSECDLLKEGLFKYARHESSRVLIAGYAIDDNPVQVWLPHESKKAPAELRDALLDPHVEKRAWNCPFEQEILSCVLKRSTTNWRDTMVRALYASYPAALQYAGPAMGLPEHECKSPTGKKLIKLFSVPNKHGGFNDHTTHPDEFAEFVKYCIQDVETERKIANMLADFAPPDNEWLLWVLDQKINQRGLPIDELFVTNALQMATDEKARLLAILRRETGLAKPTSQAPFLEYAKSQGYPYGDLAKGTIAKAVRNEELPPHLAHLLELRGDATRTSTTKYESILKYGSGGKLYNTMQFYAASRTGRWAGRGVQVQNLPRPDAAIEGHEEEITQLVRENDYDEILMRFGGAMSPLASLTRSSFRAPEGEIFYISDLNAIENRVLGWLSGCTAILTVFLEGKDPYKSFGARWLGKAYEDITKTERNLSKPATLGGGYALGGGDEVTNKNGDLVKTGLWGYAEAMGIRMTKEQAHASVRAFRESFPEVVSYWHRLRDAAFQAIEQGGRVHVGVVCFEMRGNKLALHLPSGRSLYYVNPRIELIRRKFPNGDIVNSPTITYEGLNLAKQWVRITTHGGKFCENLCQAVARDVLAAGLVAADKMGFNIVMHLHDEIVCQVPLTSKLRPEDLAKCMTAPLPWAKGLPLAASNEASRIFKK